MTPGPYNLTITRGCRFPAFGSIVLELIGGSGAFDLTGYVAQAEVRVQPENTVILDLEPLIPDPTDGKIYLTSFPDEETAGLPRGVYHWDLIIVNVTNEVSGRVLAGQVYIIDKITDS